MNDVRATALRGPSTTALFFRRTIAVILVAAGFYATSSVAVDSAVHGIYLASLVAGLVVVLPLIWMRDSDPFGPLAFTSFAFLYTYLGILASLVVNGTRALPHLPAGLAERERLGIATVGLNTLWFLGYSLTYAYVSRRIVARDRDRVPKPAPAWSVPRLWAVTFVCSVIFVVVYGEFQRRLGIPLFSFTALREGKAVWRSDPTTSWMLRGVQIGFLPLLLWGARTGLRGSRRQVAFVLAAAGLMALLVNRLGQRSMGIYPLIALFGILHYTRRRIPWAAIFAASLAIVIYVNATTRIRTGANDDFGEAMADTSTWPLSAFSEHEAERSRLDSTATILYFFPDRVDFLLGESWLPIATALVPRWIWREKSRAFPYSDTQMLRTLVGLPAPTPIPALLYANFSYFGVPIGGALMGWFHARLYAWRRRNGHVEGATILYLITLVFFQPTPAGIASTLQFVLPGFLLVRLVEHRSSRGPRRIALVAVRPARPHTSEAPETLLPALPSETQDRTP